MCLILIGRAAHIPFHHGFDSHKVLIGNQRFMGIFNLDPLSLILALYDADFVVGSSTLALCQNADIDFIGEDTLDCLVCPFCDVAGLEDGIELDPRRMLVFHWRENAHLVQPVCDTANGKAVLIHGEDHLHILTHGLIHNKLVLILRGFPVSVGSERTNKLTVLLLDLQTGSDFHGNILAVGVVYQILERNNKGVRLWIAGETVMLSIENMGSYIGYCGIKDTSQDLWEIAIELKRDWTKHGIGYPALFTMLNAIKSRLGVTEFRVRIDPTNYPSQKLFERLGAIPNGLSELWLHDHRALEKFEEENLHLIDERIVEVAKKFQVEPRKLLSHVLEYRLSWTGKGEANGQV